MATKTPPVLQAGPAPHWRSSLSRRSLNAALLVALLPAVGASLYAYGWSALGRLAFAAGTALIIELIAQKLMRQPIRVADLSALLQGLLLALLLPPTAPAWMILIGVIFMIVVAKQLFGGVGGYPFNPVLIGWAVLLLSWGNRVHPINDQLLGTGWTPAVAIGGLLILLLGHIDWQAPLGMLIGVVSAALIFTLAGFELAPWHEQLLTGSVLLGAFFLVTDTTTSPSNAWPRLLYGVAAGALVVLLRQWGIWAEPVPFALLLMNSATPIFDRWQPRARQRVVSHG